MPDRYAQLIRPGPSAAFNESQHPGLQAQRLHEDNFVALVAREPFLGLLDLDKPAEGWPAGRGPGSRVEGEVGHTGPAAVRVSGVPFDQLTKSVGAEIRREGFEDRRAGQAQVLLFHRVMVTFDVALGTSAPPAPASSTTCAPCCTTNSSAARSPVQNLRMGS